MRCVHRSNAVRSMCVGVLRSSMVNLNRTPVAGLDDVRDVDSPVSSIHKSLSKSLTVFL